MSAGAEQPGTRGKAQQAAKQAAEALQTLQNSSGYWQGGVDAGVLPAALRVLFLRGTTADATPALRAAQLPDGGFALYPEGPSNVDATVAAWCALRAAGVPAADETARKAKEQALALGGVEAASGFLKTALSLAGLYPKERALEVPPEMVLSEEGLQAVPFWLRTILVPTAVAQSKGATAGAQGVNLAEIQGNGAAEKLGTAAFVKTGGGLLSKLNPGATRRKALGQAEAWVRERSGKAGLGGTLPAAICGDLALGAVGQREGALFDSSLRETALAAFALAESGQAKTETLGRAADWLLAQEIRTKGDWASARPALAPAGWSFAPGNDFYPSIEDTAMVLLALSRTRTGADAMRRAADWLIGMQSKDGGWAAFDANDRKGSRSILVDETCPDITGKVMEALAAAGVEASHDSMKRGVAYLTGAQEQDGSWRGRWGVNHICGTCFALRGFAAAGESDREVHVQRGLEWMRSLQNFDGGWGESCASYERGAYVEAKSTPTQTAWALLGLIAGQDLASTSVADGISYLAKTQRADGGWDEDLATATAVPGRLYLRYPVYRDAFPLWALSAFEKAVDAEK